VLPVSAITKGCSMAKGPPVEIKCDKFEHPRSCNGFGRRNFLKMTGAALGLPASVTVAAFVTGGCMRRVLTVSLLLMLGLAMPFTDVMAQSSAVRGAVGGAIIGGAVGGRRGAAVGAVVGAHSQRHLRGHYYWRHGRCWVRTGGRSHPVSYRYCR
jgi:hypothetical protein